ncbi:hypothetical protein [Streptomyces javensis]|uniref:Uncharacterized protein n=1 Tax=Streptomyces javensis TaxID=114698 RepID=A0ABS0RBH9_9ACTN|nr:hypothetical protein [Streptomyces javensis]MBI0314750.1 hypothetical protein [Streptomyces javensis]
MTAEQRRVYLDTEFDPRNPTLTGLLSIGLTDDASPAVDYYAVNLDADLDALADHSFIPDHVLPYLPVTIARRPDGSIDQITWDTDHPDCRRYGRSATQIAEEVAAYFTGTVEPELLANWGKDDIGYLHRLFGNDWLQMPPGVPRIFTDLEVERRKLGAPEPPVQLADEHHALADARFNRDFHSHLERFVESQRVSGDDLAERIHAAHTARAGTRRAQPARPAGSPRLAWSDLPEPQREHHQGVARKLLDEFEIRRRPQDSR